jgi:hypothetical protein
MTEPPNAAIVALTLALLIPQGMSAQIASKLEAGALMTREDGELPASTMRVAPGIRLDLPFVNLSANGSAWLQDQQWQIADGTVSATLLSPTIFNVRGEVIANASRAFFDRSFGNDQIDGQARLHYLMQRGGIWVGGGVARPWRVAVVSHVDIAGGGAWRRIGGATISGTFTNFFFTKVTTPADSMNNGVSCSSADNQHLSLPELEGAAASVVSETSNSQCRRYSRFSDIEGSLRWEHGFFEMTAQTGYRLGKAYDVSADSRRWAAATATLWLTSQVAAVLGGGRVPANPARGLPARNFANLGVMLAYAPVPRNTVPVAPRVATVKGFEVRTASPGMQRITLRVGGVESVEVMGDFSDWATLQMIRRGRDLWELVLPLHAGVHQINVRLDRGPWLPPPSVPVVKDGFNGEVGILVVP